MYCIVLQCLCQRYRMIQITDKSLYNLRLTRLQHEAMGSTVLSLRDDAEVRNQIWHVIRAPALSKNIDSPRMTFNEKNNKESINFPNTLKHLEAFRDGHSCAVSTQRMDAFRSGAPWQVKLSDCSFQENTGTCIAARNSATVVVERGTFTQNGAPVIQLRDSTTLRCLSLRIPVQGLMVLFLECLELLSLGLIELKPGSSPFFGVVLCC